MKLSEKQKQIIESPENRVLVISSAAVGKTACIAARTKFLLEQGEDPYQMAVITFTIAAAQEMRERIGTYEGLFVGTIHALVYQWLCMGGYKIEADKYVDDEDFDKFFTLLKKHPECARRIKTLIVDEAQDVSDNMWYVFFEIIQPENFFIVGDPNQSIYSFRHVNPNKLFEISEWDDVITYHLNENYRNARNILAFAKTFIRKAGMDMSDTSIPMNQNMGRVIKGTYSIENLEKLLPKIHNYGDWFILARTNATADKILHVLTKNKIPCQRLVRAGLSQKELGDLMKCDKVLIGTIHSAKGLERHGVIMCGPWYRQAEEYRLNYVAATRAQEVLVWLGLPSKKNKYHTSNWE